MTCFPSADVGKPYDTASFFPSNFLLSKLGLWNFVIVFCFCPWDPGETFDTRSSRSKLRLFCCTVVSLQR